MDNLSSASRLSFLNLGKYSHGDHIYDASCSPRPNFCMCLLLRGKAKFRDCTGCAESFELLPGEVVFVPVSNRYVSEWTGPSVEYISFHFLFDYSASFDKKRNFKLQKLTFNDPDRIEKIFRRSYEAFESGVENKFTLLADFFSLLSEVFPRLESANAQSIDSRIIKSIEFIEKNYAEHITIERLALEANMSESRFFPSFKSALGITPVNYLNHYRISRAIVLIVNRPDMSMEEVGEAVGFESSTYFRRVFKSITGKNPRDYRKLNAEF